jgi:hypothetical protein
LIPPHKISNQYSVEPIPKQNPLLSAQILVPSTWKVIPIISGSGFS